MWGAAGAPAIARADQSAFSTVARSWPFHANVIALEAAGLLARHAGEVRATADRLTADIRL
jgi:hypothetical protein